MAGSFQTQVGKKSRDYVKKLPRSIASTTRPLSGLLGISASPDVEHFHSCPRLAIPSLAVATGTKPREARSRGRSSTAACSRVFERTRVNETPWLGALQNAGSLSGA